MSHTSPHTARCHASVKVHFPFIRAAAIPFRSFSIVSLMLMGSLAVYAQTNTGSIRGFVYDGTQAVIREATVTALDESRGGGTGSGGYR